MQILFLLIFWFSHFILNCYIWIGLLFQQIRDVFTKEEDSEGLKRIASKLKKVPNHLAIVMEQDFQEELAKIICWSICVGISDITIFDPTGNIKKEAKNLEEYINKQKKVFFGHSSSTYRVQVGVPPKAKLIQRPEPNSVKTTTRQTAFHVTLISHEQGRWALVQFARELSASIQEKKFTIQDITEDFIQENLSIGSPIDPDLVLLCNPSFSLEGFLPWHIRLSEIYQLNSVKNIHSKSFVDALKHYSRVEQRHGT